MTPKISYDSYDLKYHHLRSPEHIKGINELKLCLRINQLKLRCLTANSPGHPWRIGADASTVLQAITCSISACGRAGRWLQALQLQRQAQEGGAGGREMGGHGDALRDGTELNGFGRGK